MSSDQAYYDGRTRPGLDKPNIIDVHHMLRPLDLRLSLCPHYDTYVSSPFPIYPFQPLLTGDHRLAPATCRSSTWDEATFYQGASLTGTCGHHGVNLQGGSTAWWRSGVDLRRVAGLHARPDRGPSTAWSAAPPGSRSNWWWTRVYPGAPAAPLPAHTRGRKLTKQHHQGPLLPTTSRTPRQRHTHPRTHPETRGWKQSFMLL